MNVSGWLLGFEAHELPRIGYLSLAIYQVTTNDRNTLSIILRCSVFGGLLMVLYLLKYCFDTLISLRLMIIL